MEKIVKHNISSLQRRFNLDGSKKDFFFVEKDNYETLPKEPYRTETYGIGLYRKSKISLKTGLINHMVEGPSIITMGPSVIRSWTRIDDNPYSSLIFFTEPFFLQKNIDVFYLKSFTFFEENDCHILKLDETALNKFEIIFGQIRNTINERKTYEAEIVRSYINILIHEISTAHTNNNLNEDIKTPASDILINKFKTLLAKEFIRHRSVGFYADKLNITPKYLSEKVKQVTGSTAGAWIDEMVLLEAKVLLQNKELSISQISDYLNFSEQSVFSKFFKKSTNQSPLTYRKALL
ncbi:hypothetical protein AD998_20190 [bacterium 336/3]|nr:hypothetical protein AD998_20190 [bacterium 336/3]